LNGEKFFGKKEFICEVEAILSACTVKWVEEEEEEEEDEVGRRNRGEEKAEEEEEDENGVKKKEKKIKFCFFNPHYY